MSTLRQDTPEPQYCFAHPILTTLVAGTSLRRHARPPPSRLKNDWLKHRRCFDRSFPYRA